MNKTTIEWTDYTWNPVTGCNKVSQGCKNCYAETMAIRFWGDRKFTDVQLHPERLNEPILLGKKLHGKKVFVCDVSDLFHEKVSFDFIYNVYLKIERCKNTIFQILTKRPDRALEFYKDFAQVKEPIENIWIGTSCEDQAAADERIPLLLQIPAAVRFLSCEPLIGSIDLNRVAPFSCGAINSLHSHPISSHEKPFINWVIAGGESGHGARPMHPDWVRGLRDQCARANVPFFFKQWGEWLPMDHLDEHLYWQSKKSMEVGYGYTSNTVFKVGKSKSGHMLDGKVYQQFPK